MRDHQTEFVLIQLMERSLELKVLSNQKIILLLLWFTAKFKLVSW